MRDHLANVPRLCISPMSLNIIDAVIELSHDLPNKLAFIPTRRQIDYNGGYVENFTTEGFTQYLKLKKSNVSVIRDHGGPSQGVSEDDGRKSFESDAKNFDIIHIAPWAKYPDYESGMRNTVSHIKEISSINPNVLFEIGTEEAIRKFSLEELRQLINDLKHFNCLEKVLYLVIQSGANIDILNKKNVGNFNLYTLQKSVELCENNGLYSKEHNSDFFTKEDISIRFSNGLSCMNVGPQIAQQETFCYLEEMTKKDFDLFYNRVYESGVWKKWIKDDGFDPTVRKHDLVTACGHYLYKDEVFNKIVEKMDIKHKIINRIKAKILYFL